MAAAGGLKTRPTSRPETRRRRALFALGLLITLVGWAVLWTVESPWNPLAFAAMWTGAATMMWAASPQGYPSLRRHVALAALSIPLWWWFELVNTRVVNWRYVYSWDYASAEYTILASIAFSTVTPALTAATAFLGRFVGEGRDTAGALLSARGAWLAIGAGVLAQAGVFLFPMQLYPLVWVAPFLIMDGLLSLAGGRSLTALMLQGHWRLPILLGLAGLLCGVLWEFWNFWATPKWEYHVPLLGFGKVFEMPILGYGGYVPFAWSMLQLVALADRLANRRPR
jgi:hypothetical protein